MNRIVRTNNFSSEEYKGKNKDALRWARKYGTWSGGERIYIYDKSDKLISMAIYNVETKDYMRADTGE